MNFINSLIKGADNVDIKLDRFDSTYYTGDVIKGQCLINGGGKLDYGSIKIKFSGRAHSRITRRRTNDGGNADQDQQKEGAIEEDEDFSQKEKLISKEFTIRGDQVIYKNGQHIIPFSFDVSLNLPGTFQMSHSNYIGYRIKAQVESAKKEIEITLLANPCVTLNELKEPIILNKHKTVGLFCGKSLDIKVELPQTGFTLNNPIHIKCTVDNQSKRLIKLKGKLIQEVCLTPLNQSENHRNRIVKTEGTEIGKNCQTESTLMLELPARLPVVPEKTCKVLHINYIVEVKVDIKGSFNLYARTPILLTHSALSEYKKPDLAPLPVPNSKTTQSFYPQLEKSGNENFDEPWLDPETIEKLVAETEAQKNF